MKEIWINLELYFKRNQFLGIFLYFSEFSMILFSIFNNKKINKKIKNGRGARVDATWHARPRGSATWTRAARLGANISYIVFTYKYKWFFAGS